MTNRIVTALEHGAAKMSRTLGEDAGKAVKDLYHSTGHNLTGVAEDTAAADAKHAKSLRDLIRDGKDDTPTAPRTPGGEGHLPHGDSGLPVSGRDQLGGQHPNASTRPPSSVSSGGSDPVDMAGGRMFLPQSDVVLPGALPLAFTRRVESGYRVGRWFGPSWSSTADQRLEFDERGAVLVTEDGLLLSYPHPGPGGAGVLPLDGPRRPLTRTGKGEWAVEDPATGHTRHFIRSVHDPDTALLAEITDRNGNWIAFDHDPDTGAPTAIRHHAGYRLTLTTEDGRITALHAQGQELRRYSYTDGHLTAVTGPDGAALRLTYDERARVTSWTDSNGRRYDYRYDDRDRCVAEGGEAGHVALRFGYDDVDPDTGHHVTTVTDAAGRTTRYLINSRLQVVAETDPLGHTVRTEYDAADRITAVTDALGGRSEFGYDACGRMTVLVRPDGTRTTVVPGEFGSPVEITGPDGALWRQAYDERGNRTQVIDPAGAPTLFTYDGHGRLGSVTDALGRTTRVETSAAGLVSAVTDPAGRTTRYRRDAFGRVTSVTDPAGRTTGFTWSAGGRLTARTHADGTRETWTYDGEGNCVEHTDAGGGVTRYEYTHFDLLAARTNPDGARHEFTHDAALRLTGVTDPQGLQWSYAYDPAGRLAAETDFDGRTHRYTHDAAGRLVSRTNAAGQTVAFVRDRLGRVIEKHSDDGNSTYAYDAAGRLLRAAGPDAAVTYTRDALGRVESQVCDGRTLSFAHDLLGRRTRRVTPSGAISTRSYDAAGNRTGLTASGHDVTFEFDPAGQEIARRFGANTTLTHAWDARGRVTEQTLTGGGRLLHARRYAYRADDLLTSVTDSLTGDRVHDLDAAGRVTAVRAEHWSERYAYDDSGNQTLAHWSDRYPAADARGGRDHQGTRLTAAGRVRYEYDAQGRVVVRRRTRLSRTPESWRYEWNADDRITALVTPDGTRWRYRYDPFGRRVAKEQLSADGDTVVRRTDFTWDGTTLVEETTRDAGHPSVLTLTWDYDGPRPLVQSESKTVEQPGGSPDQQEIDRRFHAIVTDLVGMPRELVDENGETTWRAQSTVWGITAWHRGQAAYTPLRFPGQYFDQESGLHYNLHRFYDPETARYTSPDPLGLAPSPNPVSYVHNPHTWADPCGLVPDCVTVYRKQTEHPMSQRVEVDADGGVRITDGGSLYVNMSGDISHTTEFRGDEGQIVSFDVPRSYVDQVRATAVKQRPPKGMTRTEWKAYKSEYPEISDPTKGKDLYGIPSKLLDDLRANIVPNSGRIVQKGGWE